LGLSTIVDFEKKRRTVASESVEALKAALESAGIEFTDLQRPGVRLKTL
jgi:hypothetical protein